MVPFFPPSPVPSVMSYYGVLFLIPCSEGCCVGFEPCLPTCQTPMVVEHPWLNRANALVSVRPESIEGGHVGKDTCKR